jgi:hypothetical protein
MKKEFQYKGHSIKITIDLNVTERRPGEVPKDNIRGFIDGEEVDNRSYRSPMGITLVGAFEQRMRKHVDEIESNNSLTTSLEEMGYS